MASGISPPTSYSHFFIGNAPLSFTLFSLCLHIEHIFAEFPFSKTFIATIFGRTFENSNVPSYSKNKAAKYWAIIDIFLFPIQFSEVYRRKGDRRLDKRSMRTEILNRSYEKDFFSPFSPHISRNLKAGNFF